MKKVLTLAILSLVLVNANANTTETETLTLKDTKFKNSVAIHNLFVKEVDVWVNGIKMDINFNSGLVYPCQKGEKLEFQVNKMGELSLKTITCGDTLEIN